MDLDAAPQVAATMPDDDDEDESDTEAGTDELAAEQTSGAGDSSTTE